MSTGSTRSILNPPFFVLDMENTVAYSLVESDVEERGRDVNLVFCVGDEVPGIRRVDSVLAVVYLSKRALEGRSVSDDGVIDVLVVLVIRRL